MKFQIITTRQTGGLLLALQAKVLKLRLNCTYIISFCPEMAVSKLIFQVRMFIKYHQTALAF